MTHAEHIISKFGSMAKLARVLNHKHSSTVQTWKESGFIPVRWHERILRAGQENNVDISPADFLCHVLPDDDVTKVKNALEEIAA